MGSISGVKCALFGVVVMALVGSGIGVPVDGAVADGGASVEAFSTADAFVQAKAEKVAGATFVASTGTALAAGAVGAGIGATVGSVVPVAGTAVGAGVGFVVGWGISWGASQIYTPMIREANGVE